MDSIIERATNENWYNLAELKNEYTIFIEKDQTDRKESMLENVDIGDPNSLFSLLLLRLVTS